jgi:hypothetical protein
MILVAALGVLLLVLGYALGWAFLGNGVAGLIIALIIWFIMNLFAITRSYARRRRAASERIEVWKSEIIAMIDEATAENGVDKLAPLEPVDSTSDHSDPGTTIQPNGKELADEAGELTEEASDGGPTGARPPPRISDHKWHDIEYEGLPQWVKTRIKTLDSGKELIGMKFRYRRHSVTGRYLRRLTSDHEWHDIVYEGLPQWVKTRIKTLDSGKELTGTSFRYRRHSQTGRYQRRLRH